MKQAQSRKPAAAREAVELEDELHLAVAMGRFTEAEGFARALMKRLENDSAEAAHTEPAMALIEVLEETGRLKEAGRVAEATLQGMVAWVRPVDMSVVFDKTVRFLDVSRRAGLLSPGEFEAKREAWLSGVPKQFPGTTPGTPWFAAFAAVARTPEDARAALDRMPEPRVVAPFVMSMAGWSAVMGNLYWLSGRLPEARPHLQEAASDCGTLLTPMRNTLAMFQLGEVLSALGEKEGACGAYRGVLDRWGAAKESVTAKKAAARVKALGCGK